MLRGSGQRTAPTPGSGNTARSSANRKPPSNPPPQAQYPGAPYSDRIVRHCRCQPRPPTGPAATGSRATSLLSGLATRPWALGGPRPPPSIGFEGVGLNGAVAFVDPGASAVVQQLVDRTSQGVSCGLDSNLCDRRRPKAPPTALMLYKPDRAGRSHHRSAAIHLYFILGSPCPPCLPDSNTHLFPSRSHQDPMLLAGGQPAPH